MTQCHDFLVTAHPTRRHLPVVFLHQKFEGLDVSFAVQRHAAAPWRAWQSVIPTFLATTLSPDTDTLFKTERTLRAQLVQLQTTLSLQMNNPAFLLKTTRLGLSQKKTHTQKKRVTTIQGHFHKQLLESLTTFPVGRAVLLSQSTPHTGALMQPSSEAYWAEGGCFRAAVARGLMLPHLAAANSADVFRTCPNKNATEAWSVFVVILYLRKFLSNSSWAHQKIASSGIVRSLFMLPILVGFPCLFLVLLVLRPCWWKIRGLSRNFLEPFVSLPDPVPQLGGKSITSVPSRPSRLWPILVHRL